MTNTAGRLYQAADVRNHFLPALQLAQARLLVLLLAVRLAPVLRLAVLLVLRPAVLLVLRPAWAV